MTALKLTFIAQVISWVSVPAQPLVFATRPWSLVSYMFTHFEFWDFLSTMLWLWAFGYILQSLSGNKKLFPVYLYGGFAGSVIFLLFNNLVPAISSNINSVYPLLGGGPAVMAVAVAATSLAPRYKVFPMINIPLWALTATFALIKIGTVGVGNYGHAIALVAGGIIGFVFIWQLEKGNDWGQWMADVVDWMNDLFNPEKKHQKYLPKNQLFYKSNQKPFEKTPSWLHNSGLMIYLDKIHYKGYNSLTEEEKEFLKKASREEF